MTKNTTLTLEQFINLFNTESELWDVIYLDGDDLDSLVLKFRPEVEIG